MIQNSVQGFLTKRVVSFVFGTGLAIGLLAGPMAFYPAETAMAATTIKILAPKSGAEVSRHVTVKYAYHREGKANHIHIFIDGNFLKVSHHSPANLTLEKGHHTIMLQAATKHHDLLDTKVSVDVTVK